MLQAMNANSQQMCECVYVRFVRFVELSIVFSKGKK